MRISRRTFILGTGLAAAAPALASWLPRDAIAAPASQPDADATGNDVAFRIEGWDLPGRAPRAPAGDEVWISVGRSWRTAWR
jgi:hypothetical protein